MIFLCLNAGVSHLFTCNFTANDSTFTMGSYGKTIPFATAGDCYSSQGQCPQVTGQLIGCIPPKTSQPSLLLKKNKNLRNLLFEKQQCLSNKTKL